MKKPTYLSSKGGGTGYEYKREEKKTWGGLLPPEGGGGASIKPVDGNSVLGNVNLKSKGEGSINVFDSSTVVEAIL